MERDQKIHLLLDMQEHPEQFSEQELKAMLDEPEARELMEATSQLKQAMMSADSNKDDVDAEWQRFAQAHLTENHPERRWVKTFCETKRLIRAAATFIGILMITGIAFATIHIIRQQDKAETEQTAESTATANTSVSTSSHPNDTIRHNVVRYEEATLEQILTDMAEYYGLTLNWKSKEAKTLRLFYVWNKQQPPVEAIKKMNVFERIHLELNDGILTADTQTSNHK